MACDCQPVYAYVCRILNECENIAKCMSDLEQRKAVHYHFLLGARTLAQRACYISEHRAIEVQSIKNDFQSDVTTTCVVNALNACVEMCSGMSDKDSLNVRQRMLGCGDRVAVSCGIQPAQREKQSV